MVDTERLSCNDLLAQNGKSAPEAEHLSRAAVSALYYEYLGTLDKDLLGGRKEEVEERMDAIRVELNRDGHLDRGILAVPGKGRLRFAVCKRGEGNGEQDGREMIKTTMCLEEALDEAEAIGGEVVPEVEWRGRPRRFLTEKQIKEKNWAKR